MSTAAGDLVLMMLADGRLPVGGHTQSAGLEPAVFGGLAAEDIPELLATRLRTVVAVEAGTAVVARHVAASGLALDGVRQAWAARTPSEVTRAASVMLGRGYLRLMTRLWPDAGATRALAGLAAPAGPPRAVAVGALGSAAGLTPRQVATLVCYDDVQAVCAAALKLCPLDPADATAWLLDAIPMVEDVVARVCFLTEPDGIPAASAPLMEAWQHRHPQQPRRLFSA